MNFRGREVKKSGGGGHNWGKDAAAGIDNAIAAGALEADGGAGWAANGNAAEVRYCCALFVRPLFVHMSCFGRSQIC